MRKVIRQLIFIGILSGGFVLLQGMGCREYCEYKTEYPAAAMVGLKMLNLSDGEVHMWAVSSGNTISTEKIAPSNKLMAGEERIIQLKCMWDDEASQNTITVYVGRNGAAFKSGEAKFTWDQYDNSLGGISAVYEKSGQLQIFKR